MITQEKAFENLARMIPTSQHQQEYLSRVTNNYYPAHERYRSWLQLLGLIETWVMTHDRRTTLQKYSD